MDKDIKATWVKALRSGEYKQGKRLLHNQVEDSYCCLGVLCDLAIRSGEVDIPVSTDVSVVVPGAENEDERFGNVTRFGHTMSILPPEVQEWSGIPTQTAELFTPEGDFEDSLTALNDGGKSFDEIADIIEERF